MKNEKELAYYLDIYTIEGHKTWRASLSQYKDGLDRMVQNSIAFPKITKRHTIRIDQITGQIQPL